MPPKVFISSKLQELKEEREIVEKAIFELWNNEELPFKCWRWEECVKDIPSGKHPYEVQSERVKDSNVFVLILGSKYGDFKYGQSPTHKEYDVACSKFEKDCILIYIQDVAKREEHLEKWIEEIKNKHTYKPFNNSDELKHLVKTRLREVWEKQKWNEGKLPDSRKVIIEEIIHVPMLYYRKSKYSCYGEDINADKLKVEIRGDDNSKSFIAFLVKLIILNEERDTTLYQISLTANIEKKNITITIPDMIKRDDGGKWENFDINGIDKNTSKRLCFRFISRDFLDEPEVLIKLALNHTSDIIEINKISKFMEADAIDDIKWAIGSNSGKEEPTVVISNNNSPLPGFHTDGRIPKM